MKSEHTQAAHLLCPSLACHPCSRTSCIAPNGACSATNQCCPEAAECQKPGTTGDGTCTQVRAVHSLVLPTFLQILAARPRAAGACPTISAPRAKNPP